jgi:hypothetical protein
VQLDGIEHVVSTHPLVQSAVVGLYDAPPRLVAFVRLVISEAAFAAGGQLVLALHCKQRLPAHEVPTQMIYMADWPLLASGKIDRKRLVPPALLQSTAGAAAIAAAAVDIAAADPSVHAQSHLAAAAGTAYASDLEHLVAEAFQHVLELPHVPPPSGHFFELGGSSLTAVQLLATLSAWLSDAAKNPTGVAKFLLGPDERKVRLCALQRKPRVRTYAAFLEWFGVSVV